MTIGEELDRALQPDQASIDAESGRYAAMEALQKLRMSYRRLRKYAQEIAGCDISVWTDEDVERYVDLAMRWYHEQRAAERIDLQRTEEQLVRLQLVSVSLSDDHGNDAGS